MAEDKIIKDGPTEEDEIKELQEIEEIEEDENMGHKKMTNNPELDGDGDYYFNEKYFE